jgi:hypothetical protein
LSTEGLASTIPTTMPITAPEAKPPSPAGRKILTTGMMRDFNSGVRLYLQDLSKKLGRPADPSLLNTPEHLDGLKAFMAKRGKLENIPDLEVKVAQANAKIEALEKQRSTALKNIAELGSETPPAKGPAMSEKKLDRYAVAQKSLKDTKELVPRFEKLLKEALAAGEPEDSKEVMMLKEALADLKTEKAQSENDYKALMATIPKDEQAAFITRGNQFMDKKYAMQDLIDQQSAMRDEANEELSPKKDLQAFLDDVFDFKKHPNRRLVFSRHDNDTPYVVNIFEFEATDPKNPINLPKEQVLKLTTDGKAEEKLLKKLVAGSDVTVLKEITVP